ncbi:MAG: glucose uptake permease, partial [Gemmatimonadetes bacterium]
FWLLAGGFVWVVGDLFQQYAVKYAGITRGIPLSNTNQLWGLMWGILVFGELRGAPHSVFAQVIGGSIVMALGAVVIALSSVSRSEHLRWEVAAAREGSRYGVDPEYTRSRLAGKDVSVRRGRTWVDWSVVTIATATIIVFALAARAPQIALRAQWAATLAIVTLGMLGGAGFALWKTTRFN